MLSPIQEPKWKSLFRMRLVARSSLMKPTKLRFAICGAGSFGPELAPYIHEVAEVVAVCEPDPEKRARFRERSGLPVREYERYERLLEDADIEAVAVTSTNLTHRAITVAA